MIRSIRSLPKIRDRRLWWAFCVALALALTTVLPAPTQWLAPLRELGIWFWPLFLLIQWSCALLMVPSLPVVALAAVIFPAQPFCVLMMALLGVMGSAAIIYRFSDALGLTRSFQDDARAAKAKSLIQQHGPIALALWSAAPFLPTDLGCYIAASARMHFSRYLMATVLGESLLCASVIYGARGLLG